MAKSGSKKEKAKRTTETVVKEPERKGNELNPKKVAELLGKGVKNKKEKKLKKKTAIFGKIRAKVFD